MFAVPLGLVAVGASTWTLFANRQSASFEFLQGAKPLAIVRTPSSLERGFIYTIRGDWQEVRSRVRRELPTLIERPDPRYGREASLLTLPHVEDGRVKVTQLPDCQILLMPGRVEVDRAGQVRIDRDMADEWTTIEIREFLRPGLLQNLKTFLSRTLSI